MSDTIVLESDDEFTVIDLAEQGPAGPSGSSVPATSTTLGGIIASGHFWIAANGTLYLANQTSSGAYGDSTHVAHIEVDAQGRVVTAQSVLIQPDWSSIQNPPNLTIYAPLASPTLTGTPTAPTPANGTNTTQLATTAFVANALSTYATTASLSAYLTTAAAASTYATIASLSSYLTTASASSTYQTIAGMSSYLTSATAASTYATITSLASYVTTANFTWANLSNKPTIPAASDSTPNSVSTTGYAGTNAAFSRADHYHAIAVGTSTLTWSSTVAWSCNFLQTAILTLGGTSTTLTPGSFVAGGTYVLILKQDSTGSRSVTWGTGFKWVSGSAPTISTAANAVDILTFVSDGTSMFGVIQNRFA